MPVDAGSIYSEVRIQLDKLKADITAVQTNFDKLGNGLDKSTKETSKKAAVNFDKMAIAATVALAAIGLGIKKAIGIFADFEQSIANVQSVAGATPEELAKIEEAAIAAGEATRFSASQAAEALYALASAGLDAEQAIATLDGVMQLAGATGADLGETAAFMTSTLSQFSLEAEDSTKVANVFAAAIGNSQANMNKLTTAFRQVGPVAAGLGISLEETTGALQALFDAGFQGEQAGTALRNALGQLANATGPVVQKLEALGFAYEDINPATNDFADIIGTLAEKGLTAGEVINAFGTEVGPQLLTLLKTGEKGIRDYTAAVTDTNAAAELYSIQNDTLAGSLDLFKSAAESASISLVKEFAPILRTIVDGASAFLKVISSAPTPVKIFTGIMVTSAVAVGGLAAAMQFLGLSIAAALGPISLIVTGVAALGATLVTISKVNHAKEIEEINRQYGYLRNTLDLTQDELVKLANASNSIGANAEDVASLNEEFGLTPAQVKKASDSIRELNVLSNKYGAFVDTQALINGLMQKQTDLTRDQAVELLIVSNLISARQREELQGIQSLMNANRIKDAEEADLAELSAARTRTRAENEQRAINQIQIANNLAAAERRANEEAAQSRQNDQIAARKNAELKTVNALKILQKQYNDNYISIEEFESEKIKLFQNEADALYEAGYATDDYVDSQGTLSLGAQRLNFLIGEINGSHKETVKAVSQADRVTSEYTDQLDRLGATSGELIELDRKRAIENLKMNSDIVDSTEEAEAAINAYYDALAKKDAADQNEKNQKQIQEDISSTVNMALDAVKSLTAGFSDFIGAIAAARIETIQRQLETEVSIETEAYEQKMQLLDDWYFSELERQDALEETTLQRLEREAEAAKEIGDKETYDKLQQEIRREKISNEYDDRRTQAQIANENELKEIKKKAEEEKAQIEYKTAMAKWALDITSATADGAKSVLSALTIPPPAGYVFAGISAALAALQIGTIIAGKPQAPSFQTGGIVPGSSFSGDNVGANVNSGEMILTREQQTKLFDMLSGGNAQSLQQFMNISFNINGQALTEIVAEYINNGVVQLEVN